MRLEDEYVLRQIEKLRELVARAVGLRHKDELDRADQELDATYRRLLNMDRQLFEALDARNIAGMLGDPERIVMVAQVMLAEADVQRTRGAVERAKRTYQKARLLLDMSPSDLGAAAASLHNTLTGRIRALR